MEQRQPKYNVGENVTLKSPTLYNERQGKIVEIDRIYKRIDKLTGKFDPEGLVTSESDIKDFKIAHEFDGETLIVDYGNGRKETSKFYGFSYTIETPKMMSIYSESGLSKEPPPPLKVNTSPMVTCPTCKGSKKVTTTIIHHGSKEEPQKMELGCVTCHEEGVVTEDYAKVFQEVWGEENWCSCKKSSGATRTRSHGQDYYHCDDCGKTVQIG
jgi:hypothetical protein